MLGQLDNAIATVNRAVDDPDLRLVLANTDSEAALQSRKVPVYAVRPDSAEGMVAHVPVGCRAIIIGGNEFESSFQALSEGNPLIEGHEEDMLVLLLLHELGHIVNEHYGQFLPNESEPAINLSETASKAKEARADEFAVQILKEEFEALETGDAVVSAVTVVPFLSSLSFSISVKNSLDSFGGRLLGDPEIFWDHSQSHENLEYRLLKMNHAIVPTDTSARLLSDYEQLRSNSGVRSLRIMGEGGQSTTLKEGSEAFEVFQGLSNSLPGAGKQTQP